MTGAGWTAALIAAAGMIAGCAAYDRASYEDSAYRTLRADFDYDRQAEIRLMSAQLEAAGRRDPGAVPPGARAYLGFLYLENGDRAAARLRFAEEKDRFPESAALMDEMIRRTR
jgi:hypothetical protein